MGLVVQGLITMSDSAYLGQTKKIPLYPHTKALNISQNL